MKALTFRSIEKKIILFIMLFFSFRDIFIKFGVESLIIVFSFSLLIFESLLNLKRGIVNKKLIFPFIIIVVGLFQLIVNILSNGLIDSAIGFVTIYGYLMFWVLVFNKSAHLVSNDFKYSYYKWISWIGIINSLLGIYQYFIDPSIMGLVTNKIYGNAEILLDPNVTRRAVGFLGSPQNYSLFIGIAFLTSQQIFKDKKIRFLILPALLLGGLLSGSRTFFLFIAISVLIKFTSYVVPKKNICNEKNMKHLIILTAVLLPLMVYIGATRNLDYTFYRVFDLNSWPALSVFVSKIGSIEMQNILFGNGFTFGVYSENSSGLDFSLYESYIISILFRIGLIQTVMMIMVFFVALRKTFLRRDFITAGIVMALIVNIFLTPSFGGLQMSFFIWPIILMPYLENRKKEKLTYE